MIEYNPTLTNIKLTPEQEDVMVQAIKHINEAPTALKATTRWQFWFRKIFDLGMAQGKIETKMEMIRDSIAESLRGRFTDNSAASLTEHFYTLNGLTWNKETDEVYSGDKNVGRHGGFEVVNGALLVKYQPYQALNFINIELEVPRDE